MSEPPQAASVADADHALAAMLRDISKDIAHELRGPVQSVVVNLEVMKRRAVRGETADIETRADILEMEIRRLHGLADAFLGLLRSPPAEPVTMPAETMLAVAVPLIEVLAKARRIRVEHNGAPSGTLVRVRAEPAALALVHLALALCDSAAGGDVLVIGSREADRAFAVELEIRPTNGGSGGDDGDRRLPDRLRHALPIANVWLGETGGTAAARAGSDSVRLSVAVTVPRAT